MGRGHVWICWSSIRWMLYWIWRPKKSGERSKSSKEETEHTTLERTKICPLDEMVDWLIKNNDSEYTHLTIAGSTKNPWKHLHKVPNKSMISVAVDILPGGGSVPKVKFMKSAISQADLSSVVNPGRGWASSMAGITKFFFFFSFFCSSGVAEVLLGVRVSFVFLSGASGAGVLLGVE